MLTVLVAVLTAFVPGVLLGFVAPPGRYRWAAWAAAPALTLGLIALAMAWLPMAGLPDGPVPILITELVVAGVAVAVSARVRRGRPVAEPAASAGWWRSPLPPRRELLGLAVPAAITVGLGWVLLGRLVAPPGWDAMNHGFFVRRIIDLGTADMGSVCSTGVTETVTSCSFYPLAANVAWAQATQLTDGKVSDVLSAWSILVGPLAMVAGVYVCVRLLGGRPLVASAAALAPAFLGPMWFSVVTGRITEQTAPSVAGAVAILIALAMRGAHPVRIGVLAGLASAGIVLAHTYDVLFIGVLALAFVAVLRHAWNLRRAALGVGIIALVGLVTIVPFLDVILGANGERVSNKPAMPGRYWGSFEFWVLDPMRYALLAFPQPGGRTFQLGEPTIQIGLAIVIPCMVASVACFFIPQLRWARPWWIAGVFFTAIGIWTTASDSALAMTLSSLWYGVRERVRSMIAPVYGVLAVAGAVAIGLALHWLLRRLSARARELDAAKFSAVTAALMVASLAVLTAFPGTWHPLRKEFTNRAPYGDEYVATYAWLAEHTPPGRVVAYDRHMEFMSWSYADYKTGLLFGIPPLPALPQENYLERWDAWNWLVGNEDAKPAGCQVRRFGVEYVVVGGRNMPGAWDFHYEDTRLAASDRVHLVQEFDGIKIYQVAEAGRTCAS